MVASPKLSTVMAISATQSPRNLSMSWSMTQHGTSVMRNRAVYRVRWSRRVGAFDAVLLHWFTLGVLVLSILPVAQWHNAWIGWLPYWLVGVPGALLARYLLRRGALDAAHA